MNALDLEVSAVGNHEFDEGWADLRDRVMGRRRRSRNAKWDYLGANVTVKATGATALAPYQTYTSTTAPRRQARRDRRCRRRA